VLIFIILSSLIAAPFRLNESDGLTRALMTHYGIYSIVAICCCLIGLVEIYASEKNISTTIKGLLIASVAYHLGSGLMFFPEVNERNKNLTECIYPWLKNDPSAAAPSCANITANPGNAGMIIRRSEELNIYHLPDVK